MFTWIMQLDRAISRKKGSMLILCLAVLALLGSLVLHSQVKAGSRLRASDTEFTRARLQLALTDTVFQAMRLLAEDDDLLVDHPSEKWAQPVDLVTPEGVAVRVRLLDAQRKFDLNNVYSGELPPEGRPASDLLGDLLTYCGDYQSARRVAALRDWIDPDNDGVMEEPAYREAAHPGGPGNRWLLSIGELPAVLHFDRAYFEPRPVERRREGAFDAFIGDEVTVLPVARQRPIPMNINTASIYQLRALVGLQENEMARAVIVARQEQPIRSIDAFRLLLDEELAATVQTYLDVRSSYFEVEARAYWEGASAQLNGLLYRDGDGRVTVIKWVF